jgi:hypothetical protein
MSKRGRIPAAAQNVTVIDVMFGGRPEPPEGLNEQQAEIWREIVASEPAEFFATAALRSMLVDLCRHREAASKVSTIIDTFELDWLKAGEGAKRFAALLKMRDAEIRAATNLSTKLRLTNQARFVAHAAARVSRDAFKGMRPWD